MQHIQRQQTATSQQQTPTKKQPAPRKAARKPSASRAISFFLVSFQAIFVFLIPLVVFLRGGIDWAPFAYVVGVISFFLGLFLLVFAWQLLQKKLWALWMLLILEVFVMLASLRGYGLETFLYGWWATLVSFFLCIVILFSLFGSLASISRHPALPAVSTHSKGNP